MELYESGKTVFTRKELAMYAKKKDQSRSEASLDFEIDLVTVNSNSKEKYRDPEKLFLYRIDRGRYTLYNPELHGPIDEHVYGTLSVRRDFVNEIARELENRGYKIEARHPGKLLAPDIIAKLGNEKVSIWIIDPVQEPANQLKNLAYIIGSILLSRGYSKHIVIVPQKLLSRIPATTRDLFGSLNIRFMVLREERKYSISA